MADSPLANRVFSEHMRLLRAVCLLWWCLPLLTATSPHSCRACCSMQLLAIEAFAHMTDSSSLVMASDFSLLFEHLTSIISASSFAFERISP